MLDVSIAPQWTIRRPDGAVLSPRVTELLVKVEEQGSLAAACKAMGTSYRHGWQLLREGEALFGQPLLTMTRGKGSQLTPLGERLVWAQRRVQARLRPLLDTLASELGAEVAKALHAANAPHAVPCALRIHASHGFAVQSVHEWLERLQVAHELKYCGSAEALASLRNGGCEIAGLHVPLGTFEAVALEHYRPWFDLRAHRLVRLATRRQGLMVAAGNPKKIYEFADLARADVRFINRQAGSGTRFLLDLVLREAKLDPARINGYEQCEFTHAAVAAFVASGMADAGFGVEVPAREFKLEFLPTHRERYFFLCHERNLASPDVRRLVELLQGDDFRAAVNRLPGYQADASGTVATLDEVFPALVAGPAPAPRP